MELYQGYSPHGGEIWFRNFNFRSYHELMEEIEDSEKISSQEAFEKLVVKDD